VMSNGIHQEEIDNWTVTWESAGHHRLWCKQEHPSASGSVAVVMLNPGSLSATGERLRRDTTLRILRDVFLGTGNNPFIVNLFTLATPSPSLLFEQWEDRDHPLSVRALDLARSCDAVMYAYGAYGVSGQFADQVNLRIQEIRSVLGGLREVEVPLAKTGTPKHPMRIQIECLKDEFRQRISSQVGRNA